MTLDEYKIDDIKKLLSKIEQVKEKKHIEKIKNIIFKENPELTTTKKSSGTLLFFHNLSQNTYKKIDAYFLKLEKEKIESITATISDTLDETSDIKSDKRTDEEPKHIVKLSNSEKKIMKRKEYYNQINSDNKTDDVYVSDDDIFLKN
jgi:CHAD domain-containing protein